MQKDLSGLARELRKESCPQRVIDAALRRIAAETPRPNRFRYAIPVAFAGMVLLVCGLLVPWRPAGGNVPRQPEWVEHQAHGSTQATVEVERVLDLFGAVLLDAGARSETIISDRTMPPLRHGFDTATNTIVRHTKL
jgi:hypothetical protein